jgi:NADH-quinone oxidoreductase subunit E
MCCDNLKEQYFNELSQFIDSLDDKNGALITVLHKAQNLFGYLSQDVQRFVAKKLNIPVSKVNVLSRVQEMYYRNLKIDLI